MFFQKLMNRYHKCATTILAYAMMAVVGFSTLGCHVQIEDEQTYAVEEGVAVTEPVTETLRLPYSDESYTAFFEDCISRYRNTHPEVAVELNLIDSTGYLETIYAESFSSDTVTDVYLTDNASLGTAYLAGLTSKNIKSPESEDFCDAALNACSYEGAIIGYPLAYRTTFLVYNKAYLTEEEAESISTFDEIEEFAVSIYESDEVEGEEALTEDTAAENETATEAETEEPIDYSAVEKIFECNLTDIFLNYGFLGFGMNIGGEYGSDSSQIVINSAMTRMEAQKYVELIDYFSIDTSRTYESVLERFLEGKSVFTIVSTDSLATLEAYREETEGSFEYGVIAFPNFNAGVVTAPLAITTALAVNPYSEHSSTASDFAYYVTHNMGRFLYEDTGYLSAREYVTYDYAPIGDIYESYAKSKAKNKLQYGEAIYPMIEIAMHNIVAGEDIETQLQSVDDYMATQYQ